MEASFYPPRDIFNNNTFDDNLLKQHEALKRTMNIHENTYHIGETPPPIKFKRKTKKDTKL